MNMIREAAVAGQFYPASSNELATQVNDYLESASTILPDQQPKALIVPHAGYIYSGPVAASAFKQLYPFANKIKRVVLLGPSHRVPLYGIATTSASSYRTPLGNIPLDHDSIRQIESLPQVQQLDQAHEWEHSLEVQLPFLQQILEDFTLVPLVVGQADTGEIAEVIDDYIDDRESLVVVSSDLSHYHDYIQAQKIDEQTASAIETLDDGAVSDEGACGRYPVKGLLASARHHHLQVKTLDLRNSGDTAGSRDRVVGYGAWVFY